MHFFKSLLMSGVAAFFLAACTSGMKAGVLDVSVVNQGERPLYDVRVEYSNQPILEVTAMNGGESTVKQRYFIEPEVPLRITYTTADNRTVNEEYEVRARPQDGGRMEFRVDREGAVTPVGRFDVY